MKQFILNTEDCSLTEHKPEHTKIVPALFIYNEGEDIEEVPKGQTPTYGNTEILKQLPELLARAVEVGHTIIIRQVKILNGVEIYKQI